MHRMALTPVAMQDRYRQIQDEERTNCDALHTDYGNSLGNTSYMHLVDTILAST